MRRQGGVNSNTRLHSASEGSNVVPISSQQPPTGSVGSHLAAISFHVASDASRRPPNIPVGLNSSPSEPCGGKSASDDLHQPPSASRRPPSASSRPPSASVGLLSASVGLESASVGSSRPPGGLWRGQVTSRWLLAASSGLWAASGPQIEVRRTREVRSDVGGGRRRPTEADGGRRRPSFGLGGRNRRPTEADGGRPRPSFGLRRPPSASGSRFEVELGSGPQGCGLDLRFGFRMPPEAAGSHSEAVGGHRRQPGCRRRPQEAARRPREVNATPGDAT